MMRRAKRLVIAVALLIIAAIAREANTQVAVPTVSTNGPVVTANFRTTNGLGTTITLNPGATRWARLTGFTVRMFLGSAAASNLIYVSNLQATEQQWYWFQLNNITPEQEINVTFPFGLPGNGLGAGISLNIPGTPAGTIVSATMHGVAF